MLPMEGHRPAVISLKRRGSMCVALQRIMAVAAAVSILLTIDVHAQAQGKWVKLAPFPEPAFEIAGATVNGKIYVFGGLPAGGQETPVGLVYEYDSAAN